MAKKKLPRDVNQRAKSIVAMAAGEAPMEAKDTRNAAAVALGALGGKARTKKLSATRRSKIAKSAAKARWENRLSR